MLRVEQALKDLNQNVLRTQLDAAFNPALSATSLDTPLDQAADAAYTRNGVENAVLESMHTSTTEAILQWPHFVDFPSLRSRYVSIFQLEHQRTPIDIGPVALQPYIATDDIDEILSAFERNVNFWYPTLSCDQLQDVRAAIISGSTQTDSIDACLASLVMALGCASQLIAGLTFVGSLPDFERRRRVERRRLGNMYFFSALKKLYVAHTDVSSGAAQCLLLTT